MSRTRRGWSISRVELAGFEITLLATGGTHAVLKEAGLPVRSLQDDMNLPQVLSGRVKTLHSPLFGAILAKRTPEHLAELRTMKVDPIDMVVVNFYPFEKVVRDTEAGEERIIENIDIGGPSMVRAAAKNFEYVTVVPSPRHYGFVAGELKANSGRTTLGSRRRLALEAFSFTASYDAAIHNGLRRRLEQNSGLPERFLLSASKFQDARYGENPDQRATIYSVDGSAGMTGWARARRGNTLVQQLPRHRERLRHTGGIRGRPIRGYGQTRQHQRLLVRPHGRGGLLPRPFVRPRGRLRRDGRAQQGGRQH